MEDLDWDDVCDISFIERTVDGTQVRCALYHEIKYVSFPDCLSWTEKCDSYKFKNIKKRFGKDVYNKKIKNLLTNWFRGAQHGKLVIIDTELKKTQYVEFLSLDFLLQFLCDKSDALKFFSIN